MTSQQFSSNTEEIKPALERAFFWRRRIDLKYLPFQTAKKLLPPVTICAQNNLTGVA
jgi:hypothetical protein